MNSLNRINSLSNQLNEAKSIVESLEKMQKRREKFDTIIRIDVGGVYRSISGDIGSIGDVVFNALHLELQKNIASIQDELKGAIAEAYQESQKPITEDEQ